VQQLPAPLHEGSESRLQVTGNQNRRVAEKTAPVLTSTGPREGKPPLFEQLKSEASVVIALTSAKLAELILLRSGQTD